MNFAKSVGASAETFQEVWAARLTAAAYSVALRHCATSRWIDLQLELWRALSATIAANPASAPFIGSAEEWSAELADVAYRIALPYGRHLSFLALELELHQALCGIMEGAEPEA